MGEKSEIGWTEATWNPWHGCIKISPGCKNCYMYRDKERYGQDPRKVVRSKTTFNDPLKWKDARVIFTCSWSDFFIAEADAWRESAWDIIRNTPQHTYQILTKRPERIADCLPSDWQRQDRWKHVWLGVSCENQETADERIPILLQTLAAVHWVSAEPLLGPIHFCGLGGCCSEFRDYPLDWVVFGGESGSDFRPMEIDWLRDGIDQLKNECDVKVFTKQDSGFKPGQQGRIPDDLWLKEFPKAGVEH